MVVVQSNLVDNQYLQKSENLYTYINLMAIFLNVKPSNLVFLKSFNTYFHADVRKINDELKE